MEYLFNITVIAISGGPFQPVAEGPVGRGGKAPPISNRKCLAAAGLQDICIPVSVKNKAFILSSFWHQYSG